MLSQGLRGAHTAAGGRVSPQRRERLRRAPQGGDAAMLNGSGSGPGSAQLITSISVQDEVSNSRKPILGKVRYTEQGMLSPAELASRPSKSPHIVSPAESSIKGFRKCWCKCSLVVGFPESFLSPGEPALTQLLRLG